MMCDVDNWAGSVILSLEVIAVGVVIYLDVDVERFGECANFDVVSVCSAARHTFEIGLPGLVDLFLSWRKVLKRG